MRGGDPQSDVEGPQAMQILPACAGVIRGPTPEPTHAPHSSRMRGGDPVHHVL